MWNNDMMKKCMALCLAAALAMALCGCGGNMPEQPSAAPAAASAESSEEEQATIESSTEPQSSVEESSEQESSAASLAESSLESSEPSKQGEMSEDSKKTSSRPASSLSEVSKTEQSSRQTVSTRPQQQTVTVPVQTTPVQPQTATSVQTSSQQTSQVPQTVGLNAIGLNTTSVTLTTGQTCQLSPIFYPSNASRKDYSWSWSDSSVVSVASNGVVTALAPGSATVTVTSYDGKTAECLVTVLAPEPQVPVEPVPSDVSDTSVGSEWFDDAVFVGDSVSVKLSYYAENGELGNAAFLCAVSLGYNNALWDLYRPGNVHPMWNGTKVTVDEGVRLSGKKKVFIMLGMNDIGGYGVEGAISGMQKLTDRILQKSPDVQIYIQSVTPLISSIQRGDMLNNTNVAKYNARAKEVCHERGFIFVSVAEGVSDAYGNLKYEYCGDPGYMGLHFNEAGCRQWVAYLKTHVE